MHPANAKQIVLRFNDCINARDIDGLASLMTHDHAFIDSENDTVRSKARCLAAWREFFAQFPDYQNIFTTVLQRDDRVILAGYSTCSDARLDGPALWSAYVRNGRVAEWRVYGDTPANRQRLDIPDKV